MNIADMHIDFADATKDKVVADKGDAAASADGKKEEPAKPAEKKTENLVSNFV